MTAKVNSLQAIRHDLQNYVGKPIRLRANRGRKKILEVEGILEKTYPNLFVIRLEDGSPVQTDVLHLCRCSHGDRRA